MGVSESVMYRGQPVPSYDRRSAKYLYTIMCWNGPPSDVPTLTDDAKAHMINLFDMYEQHPDDRETLEAQYRALWPALPRMYRISLETSRKITRLVYAKERPVYPLDYTPRNQGLPAVIHSAKRKVDGMDYVVKSEVTDEAWAWHSLGRTVEPTVRGLSLQELPLVIMCDTCHMLFYSDRNVSVCEDCQCPDAAGSRPNQVYAISCGVASTPQHHQTWHMGMCLSHVRLLRYLMTDGSMQWRPRPRSTKVILFETYPLIVVDGIDITAVTVDPAPDEHRRLCIVRPFRNHQSADIMARIDGLGDNDDDYRLCYCGDDFVVLERLGGMNAVPAVQLSAPIQVDKVACVNCGHYYYHRRWMYCHACRNDQTLFEADLEHDDRVVYNVRLGPR